MNLVSGFGLRTERLALELFAPLLLVVLGLDLLEFHGQLLDFVLELVHLQT